MSNQKIEIGQQVRTKIALGPHLQAGSIGVLLEDNSDMYPNSADEQFVLSVVFKSLGIPKGQTYRDLQDRIDKASVPHYNVVAMRRKDVEPVAQSHNG